MSTLVSIPIAIEGPPSDVSSQREDENEGFESCEGTPLRSNWGYRRQWNCRSQGLRAGWPSETRGSQTDRKNLESPKSRQDQLQGEAGIECVWSEHGKGSCLGCRSVATFVEISNQSNNTRNKPKQNPPRGRVANKSNPVSCEASAAPTG